MQLDLFNFFGYYDRNAVSNTQPPLLKYGKSWLSLGHQKGMEGRQHTVAKSLRTSVLLFGMESLALSLAVRL